jgi:hypothetical protein
VGNSARSPVPRQGYRPAQHREPGASVPLHDPRPENRHRHDHHGPTLYYLTLPVAWLRGQHTLASLDERTLRAVPAVFGAGLLLLFTACTPFTWPLMVREDLVKLECLLRGKRATDYLGEDKD